MSSRDHAIVELFRRGRTMLEVADVFGISAERVRQVLTKNGTKTQDGGAFLRAAARRREALDIRNAECQKRFGCSVDELRGVPTSARRAWQDQRRNARSRGVPFLITLYQWWCIWSASGKYETRGRLSGQYVMARHGDVGGYEVGNVSIQETGQNIKDGYVFKPFDARKKAVPRIARKGYSKVGKRFGVRLGGKWTGDWFDSADEAREKYLERFAESL